MRHIENHKIVTLANGLRVCVVQKPGFSKKFAFLAANFGAADRGVRMNGRMRRLPAGTAHFMEHCMFSLPGENCEAAFAALGAANNAFTDDDVTGYYIEATDRFFPALELLLRMVTTAHFPQALLEQERKIIASEIDLYADSAEDIAFERMMAGLYRYHPAKDPIGGTKASIRRINEPILQACFDAYYTPENLFLCVMGDVEPEAVYALAEKTVKPGNGKPVQRGGYHREVQESFCKLQELTMDVSMPVFNLGFKAEPAEDDPFRAAAVGMLAVEALAVESSRLYESLYEHGIIDESFEVSFEVMRGLSFLQVSGDSNYPEKIVPELLKEAERIASEGIPEEDFRRFKKSLYGRSLRALDGFEATCYRICSACFAGQSIPDDRELLDSISVQEVEDFLSRTVKEDHASVCIIRPVNT